MVSEIENIRESFGILSKLIEAVEFITLLTLPILLPLGIMIISSKGYYVARLWNLKEYVTKKDRTHQGTIRVNHTLFYLCACIIGS